MKANWARGLALGWILAGGLAALPLPAAAEPVAAAASPSYLLLLLEDGSFQAGGPEDMKARIEEYSAWARKLAEKGQLLGAEKLKATGMILGAGTEREARPDELPGGNPGGVAGFFILKAESYRAAAAIAATCPHLKHGGTIALREIHPLR